MGYRLYREVLDHAPADLTAGELVVWLVLADDANDDTRCGWIERELLQRRARMGASGVSHVLRRLAGRGYELRVAAGTDKRGRPVFAHHGRKASYRLPRLPKGGPASTLHDGEGWTSETRRVDQMNTKVGPPSTPSPQAPQIPQQQAAAIVAEKTGATPAEAAAVAELIQRERNPRNLPALVRHIADDGELSSWLDKVRAEQVAADRDQAGRQQHLFTPGRSHDYCQTCGRHKTNRVHVTGWWDN